MEAYSHRGEQKVRVSIEAGDFTCEGVVHLPGMRLSDVMNEQEPFLVVVDAVVRGKGGDPAEQSPVEYGTLFLRKGEIKYVVPLEDPGRSQL